MPKTKITTVSHGYDLDLMSSLPNGDPNQAKQGKIYLSGNGVYVVRDVAGIVHRGQLEFAINLEQLEQKINEPAFKAVILEKTSRAVGYTISNECFNVELNALAKAGFNNLDIDKLIFRRSSRGTVQTVLNSYNILLEKPYNLDRQQILRIASHDGGSKNIAAVQKFLPKLMNFGFNADQVIKIVGHDGGSNNIDVVQQFFPELKAFGFSADQVVKIAGHSGGSNNIAVMLAVFPRLRDFGFKADDAVRIACRTGGSHNLKAVHKNYERLRARGYDNKKIISIAASNCGTETINTIMSTDEVEESDFLYFVTTVSTPVASQNLSSASNTNINYSNRFMTARKKTSDDNTDEVEEDQHRDKRRSNGR
ncbi:MAG: hypothetical protein A3E88_06055 [Legionellales bacterium RIFCSPHIGHO2_12_FULL_35_11]|nr:MAG: hypothetical protein A3E88_06055 [Legionellales bacterium RIFCSPHIGHO2_12_FULL_35_11]